MVQWSQTNSAIEIYEVMPDFHIWVNVQCNKFLLSSSGLVWLDPILNMLLLVHMSILTNQGGNLPYRSPLSLLGHSKCSFMCSNTIFQCDWTGWKMTQNVGWGKFCAKRASEIVVPPKEMLLSFSCVRFLTNYDVRERKQHIDLTILCVLKTNFWTAIK